MNELKSLLLLALLLACRFTYSQTPGKDMPTPPNGVWMRDSLFMDKTEITNIAWLEYMHYLAKDSSHVIYEAALPDTLVWLSFQDTLKVKNYLRSPAYRYFPVVGTTYEQAVNYCRWRSQAVSRILDKPERRKAFNIKEGQHATFTFRLPAEKEWIEAASGSLDIEKYPYGYITYGAAPHFKEKTDFYYEKTKHIVSYDVFKAEWKAYLKSKDESFFNTIRTFKNYFEYGDYAPRSVNDERTRSNPTGVNDMIGNVSEIVQQKGFAKGGSWAHSLDGSKINKVQLYAKPEAWLGFRCICEVTLAKK